MARRDTFIDHLQQVSLFSACSRKDLQLVARRAEDVRVPAGKVLVTEGETGHEFFVILDGTAKVTRQGRTDRHPRARAARSASWPCSTRRPATRPSSPRATWSSSCSASASSPASSTRSPASPRKLLAGMAKRLRESDAKSVQ